jgi:hypothetical protein
MCVRVRKVVSAINKKINKKGEKNEKTQTVISSRFGFVLFSDFDGVHARRRT